MIKHNFDQLKFDQVIVFLRSFARCYWFGRIWYEFTFTSQPTWGMWAVHIKYTKVKFKGFLFFWKYVNTQRLRTADLLHKLCLVESEFTLICGSLLFARSKLNKLINKQKKIILFGGRVGIKKLFCRLNPSIKKQDSEP